MRIGTTSCPGTGRHFRPALVTTALAIAVTLAIAGPASAGAGHIGSRNASTFAAQARHAGLTKAQAGQLQESVNGYLDRFGGTQVSVNKIEIAGKGHILVAVPGEQYARDLSSLEPVRTQAACPDEHFCMYRGTYYTGSQWNLYYCGTYTLSDWVGYGSYINNQTPGTVSALLNANFRLVSYSVAYQVNPVYDWNPIWYVVPC